MKDQILKLRKDGLSIKAISRILNTTDYQVIKVLRNIKTFHRPSIRAALTTEQAIYVIESYDKSIKILADELGVTKGVIQACRYGRSHTYLG